MRRARTWGTLLLLSTAACGGSGSSGQSGLDAGILTLTDSAQGKPTNGSPLVIVVVADTTAAVSASVWIDGTQVQSASAPNVRADGGKAYFNFEWNAPAGTPEGEHTLQARATVDGTGVSTPVETFVLDRTPPQVSSVDPADHARTVCPRDNYLLHFDEAMARWADAGVGAGVVTFTLQDGGAVPYSAALTDDGGTMVLQTLPGDGGTASAISGELTLHVPAYLSDLASNPIEPFQASWTIDAGCALP